jgi:Methyltransferase domain
VTIFELSDIETYRREYGRLATALGVLEATPAPGEVDFLDHVTTPGRFPFGMLSTPDLLFAGAVASILRPPVMIEIGTASGFSAAVLAKTISLRLEELGCPASGPVVHTFDKKVQYTEEQNQPIGFAVDLISRGTRDLVAVHASQDSSHCAQFVEQGDLTFAFIDGNHQHPWPLLDVLRIQRLMHTGWILLHDIDLPGVITRARAAGQQIDQPSGAGAKHVFDSWPSGKIGAGNIGIIRVCKDRSWLREWVAQLRALPSQVTAGNAPKRWREIHALLTECAVDAFH